MKYYRTKPSKPNNSPWKENCTLWNEQIFLFTDGNGKREDAKVGELLDVFFQFFHTPYNEESGRDRIYDAFFECERTETNLFNRPDKDAIFTESSYMDYSKLQSMSGEKIDEIVGTIKDTLESQNHKVSKENIKLHLFPNLIFSAQSATPNFKMTVFQTHEYGFFQQIYPYLNECKMNSLFANMIIETYNPNYYLERLKKGSSIKRKFDSDDSNNFPEIILEFETSIKALGISYCKGDQDTFMFVSNKYYPNHDINAARATVTIEPDNTYKYEFEKEYLENTLNFLEHFAPLVDSEFLFIVKLLFSYYDPYLPFVLDAEGRLALAKLVEQNTNDNNSIFNLSETEYTDFTDLLCHSLRSYSYSSGANGTKECKHCKSIFLTNGKYLNICSSCISAKKALKNKLDNFCYDNLSKYLYTVDTMKALDLTEYAIFLIRAWTSCLFESIMENTSIIDDNVTPEEKERLIRIRFKYLFEQYQHFSNRFIVEGNKEYASSKAFRNSYNAYTRQVESAKPISELRFWVLDINNYVYQDIFNPEPELILIPCTLPEIYTMLVKLRKITPSRNNMCSMQYNDMIKKLGKKYEEAMHLMILPNK